MCYLLELCFDLLKCSSLGDTKSAIVIPSGKLYADSGLFILLWKGTFAAYLSMSCKEEANGSVFLDN